MCPLSPISGKTTRVLPAALLSMIMPFAHAGAMPLDVGGVCPLEGSPAPKLASPGVIELEAPFSTNRNSRVKWDVKFPVNLKRMSGISFDFLSRDNDQVSSFSLYFNCGEDGCYTTSFVPGKSGERKRIVIDKSLARRIEGNPAGCDIVCNRRLARRHERHIVSSFKHRGLRSGSRSGGGARKLLDEEAAQGESLQLP